MWFFFFCWDCAAPRLRIYIYPKPTAQPPALEIGPRVPSLHLHPFHTRCLFCSPAPMYPELDSLGGTCRSVMVCLASAFFSSLLPIISFITRARLIHIHPPRPFSRLPANHATRRPAQGSAVCGRDQERPGLRNLDSSWIHTYIHTYIQYNT